MTLLIITYFSGKLKLFFALFLIDKKIFFAKINNINLNINHIFNITTMTRNQIAALTVYALLSGWVVFNFVADYYGSGVAFFNEITSGAVVLMVGVCFSSWINFAFGHRHQTENEERVARKKNMRIGWALAVPHIFMVVGFCCFRDDYSCAFSETVFLAEGLVMGLIPMLLGFADDGAETLGQNRLESAQ
jgi:hypothetical protein